MLKKTFKNPRHEGSEKETKKLKEGGSLNVQKDLYGLKRAFLIHYFQSNIVGICNSIHICWRQLVQCTCTKTFLRPWNLNFKSMNIFSVICTSLYSRYRWEMHTTWTINMVLISRWVFADICTWCPCGSNTPHVNAEKEKFFHISQVGGFAFPH